VAVRHATVALKLAKEFHVFHQRHLRKTADIDVGGSPAEYPVIATPHSQQNPGIMRKTIRQSINVRSRQANSKESACSPGVIHDSLDLTQTFPRNFGIDMEKPENVTMRGASTNIHLYCPIAFAYDKLIAKAHRKISRAVGASTIRDNDLHSGRALAQMREEYP
jgi:hypothetical protein